MHAYKGTWFYEAQIGALVFQLRHSDHEDEVPGPRVRVWRDPFAGVARRLDDRLVANEHAGWDYVAIASRSEPTLRERFRFRLLCIENAILRALTEGGSLSWR